MTETTDTAAVVRAAAAGIKVGDRIRFVPLGGTGVRWWTVRVRDERFILATMQAPFRPKSELIYTVVDLTGWQRTYNGVGPGVVRSSLNALGGGWDTDDEGMAAALAGLQSGKWELSVRRVLAVQSIEIKGAAR
ncbi:hypothetical protein P5P86_11840 [Nocardioides sp. BP30]|uniref:hypothetical protein n=1 Tax=Nocardioides sp. BP30 TaxID=3036374 RepID=UPI0024688292|nr:hypothetical protein [Nocardioides sp. BP30]WGL50655.1 hypothetical protein P5P86_11840 [Nocardioides sp. BP30]